MVSREHQQSRAEKVTQEFWKKKRVLVTGGAGFIGSNLTERLVQLGAVVRAVDNLERGKIENLGSVIERIEFLQRDLREKEVCHRACQGIEIVFHLASKVGGINYYLQKPGEVILQNALIDTSMLDATLRNGVKRYVYASSAHVYPLHRQLTPDAPALLEEDALPAHPDLSYGWAKLLGEKQVEYAMAQGIEMRAAVLRLVGVYGKNQDLDLATGSAIPVFIRRAIEYPHRGPFVIRGTGEETRSYCYVDDVLDGLLQAAETLDQHTLLGPLNLGSEGRVKMGDLAQQVINISGKKIELHKDSSVSTLIWGQAVDCTKARKLLVRWQPRVSLEEGLRRTYHDVESRMSNWLDRSS
jgi:nucleoside-diphosphate-sugar epimerase